MEHQVELYIKRKFCAAHKLEGYKGPCSQLHGHTFLAEVWLRGPLDPETSMVVDFKAIKNIIDRYDHTNLNELPDFQLLQPTAEAIALRLFMQIPDATKIRVWESSDAYAEVKDAT